MFHDVLFFVRLYILKRKIWIENLEKIRSNLKNKNRGWD